MRSYIFIFSFLLALIAAPQPVNAETEGSVLFVTPHRLVLESSKNADVLSVANKSAEPRRYDLQVVDQVMNENGITQRQDTFAYSAKKMIQFVPKRFTLKPGETQTVRVQIRRPKNLTDGDYHSHLLFREVPLSVKDKAKEAEKQDDKKISFEIRTLYGVAVPVIVQAGTVTADVEMNDIQLGPGKEGKGKELKIGFTRIGNSEAAAKVAVDYIAPGKESVRVLDTQWVRIYREIEKVTRPFPLTGMPEGASGGKLVVSLIKDEDDDSKTVKKEIAFN